MAYLLEGDIRKANGYVKCNIANAYGRQTDGPMSGAEQTAIRHPRFSVGSDLVGGDSRGTPAWILGNSPPSSIGWKLYVFGALLRRCRPKRYASRCWTLRGDMKTWRFSSREQRSAVLIDLFARRRFPRLRFATTRGQGWPDGRARRCEAEPRDGRARLSPRSVNAALDR
jgi:hypothetical protein